MTWYETEDKGEGEGELRETECKDNERGGMVWGGGVRGEEGGGARTMTPEGRRENNA